MTKHSKAIEDQKNEIETLEQKIKDLEEELAMPARDFELRLAERLREEVKSNK